MTQQTLQHHLSILPEGSVIATSGDTNCIVRAPFVEADSDLQPGGVFVARRGRSVDGHQFIARAIEQGAVAIVGEIPPPAELSVPYVQVHDAQAITGLLAASFHDFPSRKLIIIGVTGTDGKTTTSHLLHSILTHHTQGRAGFISTIAADFGGMSVPTGLHVTTPGAPQVQGFLAQMVDAGLTHVVLEMTSHGLAQGRLNGVDLDVAVLTNITHEHLDYHGSWENYRAAKAIMFRMLDRSARKGDMPKVAVINADDPSFDFFAAIPADQVIGFSLESESDFQAINIVYENDATRFEVNEMPLEIRLAGAFNIYNALAAVAAASTVGAEYETLRAGLWGIAGVSGRMERIDEGQDFLAMVDFAHTPNALEKALSAGRVMLSEGAHLIAIFGSAGLRDVEKRRMMAEVSARLADMTILTAEDPRTEALDAILQMMADGCISQGGIEGQTFIRVPDRGEAIYRACQMARPGDIVMACGKGHEQSMCFGTTEYPWDDRDAMRAALRGKPLRTLPTAPESD